MVQHWQKPEETAEKWAWKRSPGRIGHTVSRQFAGYGQYAAPEYRRSGRARQTGQARDAVLLPARQCLSHFWHKGNDRRRLQKRSERGQKEAWKKPGNRSGQDRTGRFCQCLMPCERLSAKETFGLSKGRLCERRLCERRPCSKGLSPGNTSPQTAGTGIPGPCPGRCPQVCAKNRPGDLAPGLPENRGTSPSSAVWATRLQPVARIWASVLCDCHLLIFSDGF